MKDKLIKQMKDKLIKNIPFAVIATLIFVTVYAYVEYRDCGYVDIIDILLYAVVLGVIPALFSLRYFTSIVYIGFVIGRIANAVTSYNQGSYKSMAGPVNEFLIMIVSLILAILVQLGVIVYKRSKREKEQWDKNIDFAVASSLIFVILYHFVTFWHSNGTVYSIDTPTLIFLAIVLGGLTAIFSLRYFAPIVYMGFLIGKVVSAIITYNDDLLYQSSHVKAGAYHGNIIMVSFILAIVVQIGASIYKWYCKRKKTEESPTR